ncbi:hypothetical protein [Caldivirga maquilingensis]|uniref:Uncharacterized protein n=1 Tax=Caldivirga maquilingensis (strain ATCC 700844 / DSM 13496 / JCM 10307 / IC-167) TaxID=397948 RepID=A8M9J9_CALMQ|nr:hypothetical protein [Caldivirga maquilingensis]ABW00880.1 conserved hypothetical protein [Caldivirga maquilingensis IC-167]
MYEYRGTYKVTGIEYEPNNVVKLRLEGEGSLITVELPAIINKFKQGDSVLISLSSSKDENYKGNWDVYMWGMVYYLGENFMRISIGGFILHLEGNVSSRPNLGDKIYVGLKLLTN